MKRREFIALLEVPHIFTRKSRVQPKEILITSEKDFCNKICQIQTHAPQQKARYSIAWSARATVSRLSGAGWRFQKRKRNPAVIDLGDLLGKPVLQPQHAPLWRHLGDQSRN